MHKFSGSLEAEMCAAVPVILVGGGGGTWYGRELPPGLSSVHIAEALLEITEELSSAMGLLERRSSFRTDPRTAGMSWERRMQPHSNDLGGLASEKKSTDAVMSDSSILALSWRYLGKALA